MPELGSYGSVRGARGNSRPYRERFERPLGMSALGQKLPRLTQSGVFAVGTLIAERPPHRSVRAQFGHTAPTSGT